MEAHPFTLILDTAASKSFSRSVGHRQPDPLHTQKCRSGRALKGILTIPASWPYHQFSWGSTVPRDLEDRLNLYSYCWVRLDPSRDHFYPFYPCNPPCRPIQIEGFDHRLGTLETSSDTTHKNTGEETGQTCDTNGDPGKPGTTAIQSFNGDSMLLKRQNIPKDALPIPAPKRLQSGGGAPPKPHEEGVPCVETCLPSSPADHV